MGKRSLGGRKPTITLRLDIAGVLRSTGNHDYGMRHHEYAPRASDHHGLRPFLVYGRVTTKSAPQGYKDHHHAFRGNACKKKPMYMLATSALQLLIALIVRRGGGATRQSVSCLRSFDDGGGARPLVGCLRSRYALHLCLRVSNYVFGRQPLNTLQKGTRRYALDLLLGGEGGGGGMFIVYSCSQKRLYPPSIACHIDNIMKARPRHRYILI